MGKRAVIVDILSDASGFVKSAKEAEGAAGSLDSNVQQLGRTIVSTYAAKKIVDFGQAAVQAAAEDAAAQAVLATALRNTAGASDEQIASVEDWIDATQRAKGVADTALRPALATLTAATKNVTEAQDLMALAMDTSRAKGIPLETVATALAKAHGGNTTALTRLIPGLKEAGEKTIDFATAQERLNAQVEGQAAAWAQTDEGKLARMNIQWDEMQEQIGAALLPVMGQLLGVVSGVFDWFNSLDAETQQLVITIGLVAAGLYVGVTAMAAMRTAVQALGLTTSAAMPWLLGITAALAAVAVAVAVFSDEESAASKASKEMTASTLAAAKSIDMHRIGLLSAADAAKEYGDALFADVEQKMYDTVASDNDMLDALNATGITIEDVTEASHDHAKALELTNRLTAYAAEHNIDLEDSLLSAKMGGHGLTEGIGELTYELAKAAGATDLSVEQLSKLTIAGDASAAATLKASAAWATLPPDVQAAAQAALDAAPDIDTAASALDGAGDSAGVTATLMLDLVKVTDSLRKAFDQIISPAMDLETANRALMDAAQATTETLARNGATLDINTAAGRENRAVIQSQVDAMLTQAAAMVAAGASTREATATVDEYRDSLVTQLEMLGLNEDQISDYLDTLGLTPENVTTSLSLANEAATRAQLEGVLDQLGDIDEGAKAEIKADIADGDFVAAVDKINALPTEHSVTVRLRSDGTGLSLSGPVANFRLQLNARAGGGPVTAGLPYIVGERRAELFVPDTDGYILPRVPEFVGGGRVAGSAGGSKASVGGTVVNMHGYLSERMLDELDKKLVRSRAGRA